MDEDIDVSAEDIDTYDYDDTADIDDGGYEDYTDVSGEEASDDFEEDSFPEDTEEPEAEPPDDLNEDSYGESPDESEEYEDEFEEDAPENSEYDMAEDEKFGDEIEEDVPEADSDTESEFDDAETDFPEDESPEMYDGSDVTDEQDDIPEDFDGDTASENMEQTGAEEYDFDENTDAETDEQPDEMKEDMTDTEPEGENTNSDSTDTEVNEQPDEAQEIATDAEPESEEEAPDATDTGSDNQSDDMQTDEHPDEMREDVRDTESEDVEDVSDTVDTETVDQPNDAQEDMADTESDGEEDLPDTTGAEVNGQSHDTQENVADAESNGREDISETDDTEPNDQQDTADDASTDEAEDTVPENEDTDSGNQATDDQQDTTDDASTYEAEDTTSDVEDADSSDQAADGHQDTTDDEKADAPEDTAEDEQADAPEDTANNEKSDASEDAAEKSSSMDSQDVQEASSEDAVTVETDVGSELADDSMSAFDRLSDYMNSHNYGPGDFATYSQDSEWRELQHRAFPDYEMPELTPESAHQQLTDYMNEHNYGPDDFATYSQDPRWQELHSAAYPDYEIQEAVDTKALANGTVPDSAFEGGTSLQDLEADTKLEDLSKADFDTLKASDPEKASQMLTDYNDRHIPNDDLSQMSRSLPFNDALQMEVTDADLTPEQATMRDMATGHEYTVYPNPMGRICHMAGQQGQNNVGMHQDCGIASTAKGINDIYGKEVTSENRLVDYAKETGNCDLSEAVKYPDGTVDYSECGGTVEDNVRNLYNANGIDATSYTGNNVPNLDTLADSLKDGGVATVAVNHDLLWNYDKAQSFNPSMVDPTRYNSDAAYASRVDTYMDMHDGVGNFRADHFVNVSNAVYDSDGKLSHFVVSDTGNGTTKMIPVDYFQRAYNGLGNISVSAQGCVIGRRR